ncbi:MAG: hypothetical protein WC619_05385 [Patescibacteria group bacterium]
MSNKSLDGIKKLSGEELTKARKIVLDSIGETDKKEERKTPRSLIPPLRDRDRQVPLNEVRGRQGGEKSFSLPGRKMLDGISSGPVKPVSKKFAITKEEALKGREGLGKGLGKEFQEKEKEAPVISAPTRPVVFKRSLANGIAQIEKAVGGEVGAKKHLPAMHIRALQAGVSKKIRSWSLPGGPAGVFSNKQKSKAEEIKKKELEEQKKEETGQKEAEAKARVEKEKEKIRIKEREEKIGQERKKQREQARERWFLEMKRKLLGLLSGFGKSFRLAGKIMAFSALFLVVAAVLFYLIFALLLLKFNLDNKISRQIASFMPVPAVITKIGFIGYYNYQNIMGELGKELNNRQELEQTARAVFIEKISLTKLARKYNVSLSGRQQGEAEKEINVRLAADKEANEVSYSRINKIKELVKAPQAGESFEKIGAKYGDEQGYVGGDNEFLQLKEGVRRLEPGQISDIIITDRGYYVVEKENEKFKYIFVKSATLDGYLSKMLNELKVWVLAK